MELIAHKQQQERTLSSKEIADLTAKQHKHVMEDIRKMLDSLGIQSADFSADYIDERGRKQPCYNLPPREVKILITGYDVIRRAKVIDRLDALERAERERLVGVKNDSSNESTIRLCHDLLMAVPGLDKALATSVTLRLISESTGFNTEPMRKLLPCLKEDPPSMNATAVGEEIGWSAKATNAVLFQEGYQKRNKRGEWEPTEKGMRHGGMVPFTNNGHSGYQLLWRASIVEELLRQEAA